MSFIQQKTAVFIGHSDCFGLSYEAVKKAVLSLIQAGVTDFLSGGQGGFDRLSARCVYELKKQFPRLRNYLVIPYLSFSIFDKDVFDEIVFPKECEKKPYRAAIPARNRYMVDNAAHAVCFVQYPWGGAATTFEYAVKKGLNIRNLANQSPEKTG